MAIASVGVATLYKPGVCRPVADAHLFSRIDFVHDACECAFVSAPDVRNN